MNIKLDGIVKKMCLSQFYFDKWFEYERLIYFYKNV